MQAVSLPREADGQERGVDVGGHMTGCRNRKRKVTWRRQAYRAFLSSPPQPAQTSPRCWLGGRGCRPHKQQTTLDRPPWPTQGDRPIRDAMGWMARDALGIASHRIPAGASLPHVPGAKFTCRHSLPWRGRRFQSLPSTPIFASWPNGRVVESVLAGYLWPTSSCPMRSATVHRLDALGACLASVASNLNRRPQGGRPPVSSPAVE